MDKFKRHLWLSPQTRTFFIFIVVLFALLYGMLPYTVLRQPSVVERVVTVLNKLPFVNLDLALTQQWTYAWIGKAFDIVLVIFVVIAVLFVVQAIKDVVKGKPQGKMSIGEINREIRNKMNKFKK